MKLFTLRKIATVAVIAVLSAVLVFFSTPSSNAGGVPQWNTPVCGARYVPVNLGHGNYFNIYNAQDRSTCVSVEHHHLAWYVTYKGPSAHGWEYPNISSGIEWGRYTCYDGHSAYPGHGSQCMRYPVQEYKDGTPLTSVEYWPHLQNGNVVYDIWFNKTYVTPSKLRQNNGAEIMIWLAHPGIRIWNVRWYVTIQGVRYAVMNWVMNHNGKTWNYLAYVAVHQTRVLKPTWLNGFFRDAIRHGQLSPYWWLTAIDFGSEMNRGGQGFAVHSYRVTGVR